MSLETIVPLVVLAEIHAGGRGNTASAHPALRTVLGRHRRGSPQAVPEVMTRRRCRRRAARTQLQRLKLHLRGGQLVRMPQADLRQRGGDRRGGLRLQVVVQVRLRLGLDVQLLLQQEGGSVRGRRLWSLGGQSGTSTRGGARRRRSLR